MRYTLAVIFIVSGCSSGLTELKADIESMRSQVADISRNAAAMRKRLDEMENRLLLIQDQVETQKMASVRMGPRIEKSEINPELPVVKVIPKDSADSTKPSPADPSVLEDAYQVLDDQGRVVSEKRGNGEPKRSIDRNAMALEEYKSAYALYEAGRLEEARIAFSTFVARYPKHPYADNAQYWVGECYYDQKDYEAARREFMRVVKEHPDGNKVPDAMVKIGLCNQMLKRSEEARRMYDAVVLTYPDSHAAAVALRLISELQ